MSKTTKLLTLLTLLSTISLSASYAIDYNIHFGAGLQTGHFNPDKKISDVEASKFVETTQLDGTHTYELKKGAEAKATGRETGLYVQVGADLALNEQYKGTFYVDLASVNQYKKGKTMQTGIGSDVSYKLNQNMSLIGGVEAHSAIFGFKVGESNPNSKIKETKLVYKGFGTTINGGVTWKLASIKLFATMNKYTLNGFDTGASKANELIKKALPKNTATTSIGVMIGLDF